MRFFLTTMICLLLAMSPVGAQPIALEDALRDGEAHRSAPFDTELRIAQQGCMSLSEAIASVRNSGNVQRIVSAETRVSGGREMHYIKVITKNGTVRTHKICGRRRN